MSAICIRYKKSSLRGIEDTAFHARVAQRIARSGRFWISTTQLKGKAWFRINPVNFRTRRKHMDDLFGLLVEECRSEFSALRSSHTGAEE